MCLRLIFKFFFLFSLVSYADTNNECGQVFSGGELLGYGAARRLLIELGITSTVVLQEQKKQGNPELKLIP